MQESVRKNYYLKQEPPPMFLYPGEDSPCIPYQRLDQVVIQTQKPSEFITIDRIKETLGVNDQQKKPTHLCRRHLKTEGLSPLLL